MWILQVMLMSYLVVQVDAHNIVPVWAARLPQQTAGINKGNVGLYIVQFNRSISVFGALQVRQARNCSDGLRFAAARRQYLCKNHIYIYIYIYVYIYTRLSDLLALILLD